MALVAPHGASIAADYTPHLLGKRCGLVNAPQEVDTLRSAVKLRNFIRFGAQAIDAKDEIAQSRKMVN